MGWWIDEEMDGCVGGLVFELGGWMDECMGGWMDKWMMDGWMDKLIFFLFSFTFLALTHYFLRTCYYEGKNKKLRRSA